MTFNFNTSANFNSKFDFSLCSFIYGQREEQFESLEFAMEVFSFSQCWNIKALTEELDEYFKTQEVTKIFSIFELYVQLGHQSGLAWASEVNAIILLHPRAVK